MTLSPGARLGPYEIIALLGAGGMGEVYRARDNTLGREVAIKVLPEIFAKQPERLARFEREARLLASLNHPNIAVKTNANAMDAAACERWSGFNTPAPMSCVRSRHTVRIVT